jgi:hypothetical protein
VDYDPLKDAAAVRAVMASWVDGAAEGEGERQDGAGETGVRAGTARPEGQGGPAVPGPGWLASFRTAMVSAAIRAGARLGNVVRSAVGLVLGRRKAPVPCPEFMDGMKEEGVRVMPELAGSGEVKGVSYMADGMSVDGRDIECYGWADLVEKGATSWRREWSRRRERPGSRSGAPSPWRRS